MAWIESHQGLATHPKLYRLVSLTGYDSDKCIAKLHRLWWWTLSYAEDGDLGNFKDEEIGLGILIDDPKEAQKFLSALRNSEFINRDNNFIHDWLDYAGRYLYSKYHTSNPKKYHTILRKHKVNPKSIPKGYPKGIPQGGIPNQYNQPNQPTNKACESLVDNSEPELEKDALLKKEKPPYFSDDQYQKIDDLRKELYGKWPRFLPDQWIYQMKTEEKNPEAIIHALNSLKSAVTKNGPKAILSPKDYLDKIMSIEDGNYNEKDFNAKKVDFNNVVEKLKKLQVLKPKEEG